MFSECIFFALVSFSAMLLLSTLTSGNPGALTIIVDGEVWNTSEQDKSVSHHPRLSFFERFETLQANFISKDFSVREMELVNFAVKSKLGDKFILVRVETASHFQLRTAHCLLHLYVTSVSE